MDSENASPRTRKHRAKLGEGGGDLVREVMDDAQRERLVDNVVGHLSDGVSEPILERALEYWRNIDPDIGDRIASGMGR